MSDENKDPLTTIEEVLEQDHRMIGWCAGMGRRLARARQHGAESADPPTPPQSTVEPLSDEETRVLQLIRCHPEGIIGRHISSELDINASTLRSRIIPRLMKSHGVRNRQNVGYYIPTE